MTNKSWKQPTDTEIGLWQEKIKSISGSDTFCVLPWIHVATRPNGDARLCCGSNASGAGENHEVGLTSANFAKDSLQGSWNNDYMKSVRREMLEGSIPLSCRKCFEEETNGVASKRLWEAYYWINEGLDIKTLVYDTESDGTVPPTIRYFDFRLGHTCNLKCVMCSPHDSSKWIEDYDSMMEMTNSSNVRNQINWDRDTFNNTWHKNDEFWKEVFDQIPNMKYLYFAGGEPLMLKEHKRLLLEIIDRGYSNQISLRYNTNGLFVSDEIIEIWSKFRTVKIAFSIDAVGNRNRYIRYPTHWDQVVANLHKLDATGDNIEIGIQAAVQILNIKHLPDFAKWKLEQNFRKINMGSLGKYEAGGGLINMHLLYLPTFLSAKILPEKDKQEIRDTFFEFKDWLWHNYRKDDDFWVINPYGWKRWEAILSFIDSDDQSTQIDDFKEYINNIDKVRNLKFSDVFPELAHLVL